MYRLKQQGPLLIIIIVIYGFGIIVLEEGPEVKDAVCYSELQPLSSSSSLSNPLPRHGYTSSYLLALV